MKTEIIKITFLLLLGCSYVSAQNAHFTTDGVIEYDKTANTFAIIQRELGKNPDNFIVQAFEEYKKSQPQFKVLKSTLSFSKDKSLFTPIEPETPLNGFASNAMVAQNNTIYTDLAGGTKICKKNVFGDAFLLKDTTRKINWKITTETREIAGYACRRANAVIMDSIYVVAFYTDEIAVSGGPESFGGLPGMILGVVLPHENITWFATKVTDFGGMVKPFSPPAKGKPIDGKGFKAKIDAAMKDWGGEGRENVKAFTL